jgi:hypothetical protein
MERTSILKECEECLVVGVARIISEKTVSDSVRELSVGLSRIVILAEDHSGTTLVC